MYITKEQGLQLFKERIAEYSNNSLTVIGNYINAKTPITVECNECHHQWTYTPDSVSPRNQAKYQFKGCPNCKYITLQCEECGKTFTKLKSKLAEHNFCSHTCGNKYKNRSTINKIDSNAYRRNAFEAYPHKCDICGWDKDERIMEVHHLDENRSNNHIDNLRILCPICHKYLTLHLYDYETLKEMFK